MKTSEIIICLVLVTGVALGAKGIRVAVKTKFRDSAAVGWLLAGSYVSLLATMLSRIFL